MRCWPALRTFPDEKVDHLQPRNERLHIGHDLQDAEEYAALLYWNLHKHVVHKSIAVAFKLQRHDSADRTKR
jgi:hypothetical protein